MNSIVFHIMLIAFLLSACTVEQVIDIDYSFSTAVDVEIEKDEISKIEFEPLSHLDLGFYSGNVWIKLEIENANNDASYVIMMDDLINRNYRFYKMKNSVDQISVDSTVGDLTKYDHRTFNYPKPNFKIDLKPLEKAVFYITTSSDGRILQATPKLVKLETYVAIQNNSKAINIIFYTAICLLVLINIFYWSTLRNRIYYFYGFYILTSCLFYEFVEGHLYGRGLSHHIIDHMMFLSIRLWIFSAVLFTAKFLEINISSPRFFKIIKGLLMVILGGTTFYQLLFFNTSIQHLHLIENVFGFIWVVLALTMIGVSVRKRKLRTKYYMISFSILVTFILLGLIDSHTAMLPGDPFFYFKIGTVIEFTGFTFFIALIIKKNLEKTTELETALLEKKNELLQVFKKLESSKDNQSDKTTIEKTDLISIFKLLESTLTSEDEWSDFKAKFQGLNPNFLANLKQKHPNLSKSDLRLLVLVRIGFTQKEIASILNIAPDSAKKAKQRVRKKLGLSRATILTQYLGQFN